MGLFLLGCVIGFVGGGALGYMVAALMAEAKDEEERNGTGDARR